MARNSGNKDCFFKAKQETKNNKSGDFFVTKKPTTTTTSSRSLKTTKKGRENLDIKPSKLKQIKKNNSTTLSSIDRKETSEKKQFDKKKWRLQKYSKKYKLQQWEDKRKRAILREYYKDIKNTGNKFDVTKIYAEEEDEQNDNNINTNLTQINQQENSTIISNNTENENCHKKTVKNKAYRKAQLEFERIKEEKKRKKEEFQRMKMEKEEALKQYKKNKLEKFKKLNRKTKKGQPIMKDRIELLLEKIQQSI